MLLTTPEELRLYLPTHVIDHIESMAGFIDNSEHDFLMDKIGRPLYARLCQEYKAMGDKIVLSPENAEYQTPWMQLLVLCQRAVTFDAFFRAADIASVSVNDSGINVIGTDDYDPANKDSLSKYKSRCNIEAHRAIDRMLVQLEEWAQESAIEEAPEDTITDEEVQRVAIRAEIVALWRKSRYYYLADGLFINTAHKFNEFIDIYDSREKFIQLLPDLRYCQEISLRSELGDDLIDSLIDKYQTGQLTEIQKKAVVNLQRALALAVEARNKMFSRKDARDEAIMNLRIAITFIAKNQDAFLPDIESSPIYVKPKEKVSVTQHGSATPSMIGMPDQPQPAEEPWRNNRRGDTLFVTPSVE
ncbi:DUF6712 family protein [Bacteroides sp.]|uniref:DUF6712 family protein n=1 Tax=Bacteroides sp. TaxID=29523 RepID=UPI00262DC488|nr:DUF6712 family protein [Bacteroides sp.]MDD3037893.1 hypothetical protein [Bacteroides sp.]